MTDKLDEIRSDTLRQIERSECWFKVLVGISFAVELAGLVTFLLLMDFNDRRHQLILVAAVLVYLTISFWTWALAAHANLNARRILRAVDLLHEMPEARH